MLIVGCGKRYRGDFIAGWIASFIPFVITSTLISLTDVVAISGLIGVILISVILIFSTDPLFFRIVNWWRKSKFKPPVTIGILNGKLFKLQKEIEKIPHPYTDYNSKEWFEALSSDENFNAEYISAKEISSKFDMILNPFGELYPEVDKSNLTTLHSIVEYIRKGGVFINVAGLPFFYVWDGEKESLSGPLLQTYKLDKSMFLHKVVFPNAVHLTDCSLYQYFGIRTTMFGSSLLDVKPVSDSFFKHLYKSGNQTKMNEFRSAYRSESPNSVIKPFLKASHKIDIYDKDKKGNLYIKEKLDFDCYPISAVSFGKGFLLINGINLKKSWSSDFQKILESIKCVRKKLNFEGCL